MPRGTQKIFYVYTLSSSQDSVPFYVGKGAGKRRFEHQRDAERGACCNKHLERKICKVLREGYNIENNIVFETKDEAEAFGYEIGLIAHYGRRTTKNGTLVNISAGGPGHSAPRSAEMRTRISEKCRSLWTEDARVKHGKALREAFSLMTPQEKTLHSKRVSKAVTRIWAEMNDDEKHARMEHMRSHITSDSLKRMSEARIRRAQMETNEERENRILIHQEAAKKVDWSLVSTKVNKTKAAWSPERRSEFSLKMKEAANKRWKKDDRSAQASVVEFRKKRR